VNVEDGAVTLFKHTWKTPMMESTNQSLKFIPNGLLFSNTNDTGYQGGDGDGTSTSGTISRVEDKRTENEDELMGSVSDYYLADDKVQMAVYAHSSAFAIGSPSNIQDGSLETPKVTVSRLLQKTRSIADITCDSHGRWAVKWFVALKSIGVRVWWVQVNSPLLMIYSQS
jgi:hypothetical protein